MSRCVLTNQAKVCFIAVAIVTLITMVTSENVFASPPTIPSTSTDGELFRCEQVYDSEYGDCWGNIINSRNDRKVSFARVRNILLRRIQKTRRSARAARRRGDSELQQHFLDLIAQYKSVRTGANQCRNYYEESCSSDSGGGNSNLVAACSAVGGAAISSHSSDVSSEIVNGAVCERGSTSWVRIDYDGGQHCTGNMIAPNVVITAAHCVEDVYCDDLVVSDGLGNSARGSQCIAHTAYDFPYYDLAIIKLNKSLNADLIEIWQNDDVKKGETVVLAGYGRNQNEAGQSIPDAAFLATFNVVNDIDAQHIYANYNPNNTSYGNTCNGDSGGGLAIQRNGKWVLIGVVSGGDADNCGIFGDEEDSSFWINMTSPWARQFVKDNTTGILD